MAALDLTLVGLNADEVAVRLGPGRTGEAGWSASKNTRFMARVLESVRGEAEIYPGGGPAGACLWAEGAALSGDPWIIYVTAAGIGSFDGAHHDHTPAGWVTPRASQISRTTLNGLTILNAPPNPPMQVVKGGGAATPLPGWPTNTHCNTMTGFRYYLVAGGIFRPGGGGESTVMWSDAAEPGNLPATWTPAPENDAGDLVLSDFPGPILAAGVLSDVLIFYKFAGVFALAWVGGQAVMGRRVLYPNRGVVCGGALIELAREHVVVTAGDFMVHDGSTLRSLVEGRFRKYLAQRIKATVWEQVRLAYDVSRGEVWCAYPLAEGGPLTEALVWGVNDDTLSVREVPPSNDIFYTVLVGGRRKWSESTFAWLAAGGREWSDVSHGFDATAIVTCPQAPAGSKFIQMDSGAVAAGTRVVSAERVGIGVNPHGRRKLFTRLRPRIEGEVGSVVEVQVGAHDEVGEPVAWGATHPFRVGVDQSIGCLEAGRYAAARFTGPARWRLEGFQLEFEVMGRF